MRKSFIVYSWFCLIFCFCCILNSQARSISETIKNSNPSVVLKDGSLSSKVKVHRKWTGNNCKIFITNTSSSAVKLREVVLFSADKLFAGSTSIYGEGFQLLSQTGGTLAQPKKLGYYGDRVHYGLWEPVGYKVVYNLLELSPTGNDKYLLGFSSANRFVGKFYLSVDTIKAVMDLENLEIPAGATWKLEDFFMEKNDNRNILFNDFATAIEKNHPRLKTPFPRG